LRSDESSYFENNTLPLFRIQAPRPNFTEKCRSFLATPLVSAHLDFAPPSLTRGGGKNNPQKMLGLAFFCGWLFLRCHECDPKLEDIYLMIVKKEED